MESILIQKENKGGKKKNKEIICSLCFCMLSGGFKRYTLYFWISGFKRYIIVLLLKHHGE